MSSTPAKLIIREVPFTLTESAANTFTESALSLSSYFTQVELDKGVIPLGVQVYIREPDAHAAPNTRGFCNFTVAPKTLAAVPNLNDSNCLFKKMLFSHSGAAAGCINTVSAKNWPSVTDADGFQLLWKDRIKKIDPKNPNTSLYVNCIGDGQATAFVINGMLKFAILP